MDAPAGVRDVADGNPDPALLPSLAKAFAAAGAQGDVWEPVFYGGVPSSNSGLAQLAPAAGLDADGVPDGPLPPSSPARSTRSSECWRSISNPGTPSPWRIQGWRQAPCSDLVPALGLRITPVGVDDEGPLPEDVRRALESGARALIVTDRARQSRRAPRRAPRARVPCGPFSGSTRNSC
ncbi:Aminotransferase class I/II-fold pyridoxal phosphate-dependent enzyme OS=Streptomyces alboniger OX=132473 GN=CP975_04850 PE=3 SV=1 [Streptomyces alboniger]